MDADGALSDCCAALAAEPGSPDALHLKYQAGLPASTMVNAVPPVLCRVADLTRSPSLSYTCSVTLHVIVKL